MEKASPFGEVKDAGAQERSFQSGSLSQSKNLCRTVTFKHTVIWPVL